MKLSEFADRLAKISNTFNLIDQIKRNCPPFFGDYLEILQRETEQEFDDLCLEWTQVKNKPSPILGALILKS